MKTNLKMYEVCGDCCVFSYSTDAGKTELEIPSQKTLELNDILKIIKFLIDYLWIEK